MMSVIKRVEGAMTTITVRLPEDLAAQLEAEQISKGQLDSFLVAAIKVWLMQHQVAKKARPKLANDRGLRPFRTAPWPLWTN